MLRKTLALAVPVTFAAMPAPHAHGLTADRFHGICDDRTSAQWREAGHYVCPSFVRGVIDGARLQTRGTRAARSRSTSRP